MNKFKEKLTSIKKDVNDLLSAELPKDVIDKIASINTQLDEADVLHDTTETELADMKDSYIKLFKQSGSGEPPKDDVTPATPRSLEEIANDLLNGK